MNSKQLTILYGSQTGTAQDIAERLWRQGKHYGFHGSLLTMDEYKIQNLINEPVIAFICSTAGQGDPPDNMKTFWKFLLRKSLPSNSLQNLKYAILGLGDSSYIKFNFCAKKLHRRLLQLGAQPLIQPGYADDQHDFGADAIVHPWISEFWYKIFQFSSDIKQELLNNTLHLFPPRWSVTIAEDKVHSIDGNLKYVDLQQDNSSRVSCIYNERVTSLTHFQDTRLIKFTSQNLCYIPGDVLVIRPQNNAKSVQQFFDIFLDREDEINENVVIHISEMYPDMPVPFALQNPVSLKTIVEKYWDLNIVPRRYTFELLSHFTKSDLEHEKLIEFASTDGQEELFNYCNRPKRTILEVLTDFPHAAVNIPLSYFFELFQPIRPRTFSIASSPKIHPGEIHILVAVVKYKTNLKLPRVGLCSNWLASLMPNDEVIIYLKPGSFSFSGEQNVPGIMIGPGTGIAPFRSYIHEVSYKNSSTKHHVVFGGRNENADFYFKDEWLWLQKKGTVQLYTAFSRDQAYKIYVQDIIQKNGPVMCDLIAKKNAYIFVAGNSKNMPDAVRNAFVSAYTAYHKINSSESEKVFRRMEIERRYQTETWS